jgi:hypothetical protein
MQNHNPPVSKLVVSGAGTLGGGSGVGGSLAICGLGWLAVKRIGDGPKPRVWREEPSSPRENRNRVSQSNEQQVSWLKRLKQSELVGTMPVPK